MTKNYSRLPKVVTITNNNDYDVVLGLRNVIDAIDYTIKSGDSLNITVKTSDALALVNERVKELDLTIVEQEVTEEPVQEETQPEEIVSEEDVESPTEEAESVEE